MKDNVKKMVFSRKFQGRKQREGNPWNAAELSKYRQGRGFLMSSFHRRVGIGWGASLVVVCGGVRQSWLSLNAGTIDRVCFQFWGDANTETQLKMGTGEEKILDFQRCSGIYTDLGKAVDILQGEEPGFLTQTFTGTKEQRDPRDTLVTVRVWLFWLTIPWKQYGVMRLLAWEPTSQVLVLALPGERT